MKNKLMILAVVALLSGCAKPYEHNLSIITPTGAPALAFYNMAKDQGFETNSDATAIIPMMKQGLKDIVVLPTNAGVNAIIKQQVDYKIAATITFGNLFVASTGHDDDGVMDKDDYIVLFQQGSVPDLIFHSVYGTDLDEGVHYVGNVQFASQCLMSGKDVTSNNEDVDYVLIAEPAFTTVKSKKENVSEYKNLQTAYKDKYGTEIYQASVFVKNGVDASSFLSSLEEDVKNALANPDLIKEKTEGIEKPEVLLGVAPEIAVNVTKNSNRMGLGFKLAKDNKEGIDKFLSIFGINATSEEIYYK